MSLLDALLLDPVRINVWIAKRDDGIYGSGTQTDPYDGSTAERFDYLMRVVIQENTCVHLGPGTFETAGYYDGQAAGWQAKTGVKIVGSGIDVTILKLVNTATDKNIYAIGHPLCSETSYITADHFEVSDLTIDCNLAVTANNSSAGAVRVMGNHSRTLRIKAINWGNNDASVPGFVIGMITGNVTGSEATSLSGIVNCGIEECIAVDPSPNGGIGPVIILHVGGPEDADNEDEAIGTGGYICNCFVDCGQLVEDDFDAAEYRGLSLSWCQGGVVEGNIVQNTKYGGPFQETIGAQEVTVRNNRYLNVYRGPYWNLETQGVTKLLIEDNRIELAPSAPGTPTADFAITVLDAGNPPAQIHKEVVVRNNHYHNVVMGQFHYMGGESFNGIKAESIVVADVANKIAKFTFLSGKSPELTVGQGVHLIDVYIKIGTNDPEPAANGTYNGVFTIAEIGRDTNGKYWFKYRMVALPQPNPNPPPDYVSAYTINGVVAGLLKPLWEAQQLITENNIIELSPAFNNAGPPTAVALWGGSVN